jgi:serine/threonine protein kinase
MPLTIEQFAHRLTASGLMDLDELRERHGKSPAAKRPRDGEQLARESVKRKRLTAYQAREIYLGKDGVVKILDLGLARVEETPNAERESTLTSTGAVMGTIDCMSPEQAEDTKTADERSDIYSLGCTLFYQLIGRSPYTEDTVMKRLRAHREASLPSLVVELEARQREAGGELAALRDTWLATLDAIFRRMIAKRPGDRLPTMSAVIADLQRCLTAPVERAVPVMAVSEDSKLNDFLAKFSDSGLVVADEPPSSERPFFNEPTVQFQRDGSDTDPSTLSHLTEAVTIRRKKKAWWTDPIRIGILVVASLIICTVWWLATSPSGPATPAKIKNKKRETKLTKRKSTSASDRSIATSPHV